MLKNNAVRLFAEVNGWLYTGAETTLNDKYKSINVLMLWESRLNKLSNDARKLMMTCETNQSIRAYKKAIELKYAFEKEINLIMENKGIL